MLRRRFVLPTYHLQRECPLQIEATSTNSCKASSSVSQNVGLIQLELSWGEQDVHPGSEAQASNFERANAEETLNEEDAKGQAHRSRRVCCYSIVPLAWELTRCCRLGDGRRSTYKSVVDEGYYDDEPFWTFLLKYDSRGQFNSACFCSSIH